MKIEGKYRYYAWGLNILAAIITLYVIGCVVYSVLPRAPTRPQQWYLVNLKMDTCINSRAEASSLGFPQIATPYRFKEFMESQGGSTYAGTKTYPLINGEGKAVAFMDDQGYPEVVYFSKKRGCEKILQIEEEEDN